MGSVIYSMGVFSLDGFIAGPSGEIDWSAPEEELLRFHNQQTQALGALLCGGRLYETMVYWEIAWSKELSTADYELEFARVWGGFHLFYRSLWTELSLEHFRQ
jgi:hypothetical protein